MSTLDYLNNYWIENSTYGLSEAPMPLMREPEKRPKHFDKMGDAEQAALDEGHEEGSEEFMEAVEELREAIKKKKADRNIEKGIRGKKYWDDPYAIAAAKLKRKYNIDDEDRGPLGMAPPWGDGQWSRGTGLSDERDRMAEAIKRKQDTGKGSKKGGKKKKKATASKRKRATQKMLYKDFSPALERLLAFGAGWALSGDVAGKDVPPEMIREWERAIQRQATEADKREIARQMRRRMRKSEDTPFSQLETFYIQNADEKNPFQWTEEEDDYDFDAESDPQWDAHAKEDAEHSFATDQGWGGTAPNIDDFHPDSGERISNHGQGAHNVQNWARGVQQQTGIPLVNKLGEPHDDIYDHHGLEDNDTVTAQHISDYVQNKTGQQMNPPSGNGNAFQNMLKTYFVEKDHAPVPPRVGLMWDAVKHRWTRPERIGRTVWELSGKKRIRGTGTGSHERSVKTGTAGGRGAGSTVAGRRFRGAGDAPGPGKRHPKSISAKGEQKHPAFRRLKAFRRGRKKQYGSKKK